MRPLLIGLTLFLHAGLVGNCGSGPASGPTSPFSTPNGGIELSRDEHGATATVTLFASYLDSGDGGVECSTRWFGAAWRVHECDQARARTPLATSDAGPIYLDAGGTSLAVLSPEHGRYPAVTFDPTLAPEDEPIEVGATGGTLPAFNASISFPAAPRLVRSDVADDDGVEIEWEPMDLAETGLIAVELRAAMPEDEISRVAVATFPTDATFAHAPRAVVDALGTGELVVVVTAMTRARAESDAMVDIDVRANRSTRAAIAPSAEVIAE